MSPTEILWKVTLACTTAQIRAMGMQAENQIRVNQGYSPAYGDDAFNAIVDNLLTIVAQADMTKENGDVVGRG